jgi:hypothetical protein
LTKPKRKKGRPSKPNVSRTPSGQISRAKEPDKPMQTVLAYRQKQYGLNEAQAHDQKAGTVLGRLCLAGDITEAQYDAGKRYHDLHDEMLRAIAAPVGLRKLTAGANGELIAPDYVEWAIAAVARWKVFELRGWPVLREVVIEDKPASSGMLAELRVALSILAKKFGVESYIVA